LEERPEVAAMLSQREGAQLAAALVGLRMGGLTLEECRRLLQVRRRARRGEYCDDGSGAGGAASLTGDCRFDRRLEFARWLYEHGRISG
jgi:hypothetical protein